MGRLFDALNDAIQVGKFEPGDWAALELAGLYAKQIEANPDAKTLESLGPKLMALLVELLLTPKARQVIENSIREVASDDDAAFSDRRAKARSRYSE